MTVSDEKLEAQILTAHADNDIGTLARLYQKGAMALLEAGKTNEGAFLLTNAYIFALEAGSPQAEDLAIELRRLRRL